MTKENRRRWYQFSLRTMFVLVTVACVVLGMTARWVQNSREWIRQRDEWGMSDSRYLQIPQAGEGPSAPGGLWLIGERAVEIIVCSKSDMAEAKRLFPEANVYDVSRFLR